MSQVAQSADKPASSNKPAIANKKSSARTGRKTSLAQRYVTIVDFEFTPKVLRVQTGFKVTWVKHTGALSDEHVIKFIGEDDHLAGPPFGLNGSYTRIFTRPGIYEYYCERNVFMRGEIIVEGSPGVDSHVESKVSSPKQLPAKTIDAESKYKDYMTKRQSTRDKLTKARAKRDVEILFEGGSESKTDSPQISEIKQANKDPTTVVRFGSFDGESDESEAEEPYKPVSANFLEKPPRFGSFDECETLQSMKGGSQGDLLLAPEHPQEVKAQHINIGVAKEMNSVFDHESALIFLRERWADAVKDSATIWL